MVNKISALQLKLDEACQSKKQLASDFNELRKSQSFLSDQHDNRICKLKTENEKINNENCMKETLTKHGSKIEERDARNRKTLSLYCKLVNL